MSELHQFIRIELPDVSEEDRDRVIRAVLAVVEPFEEEFMQDITVSGGGWYPPDLEEHTKPIPATQAVLHGLVYIRQADNSPTDATMLRNVLQDLANLGMSQVDLQIHLERERAINSVVLRNMLVERNLLDALDMVTGAVGNPEFRIAFPA